MLWIGVSAHDQPFAPGRIGDIWRKDGQRVYYV
jgi:hypothetical protein